MMLVRRAEVGRSSFQEIHCSFGEAASFSSPSQGGLTTAGSETAPGRYFHPLGLVSKT